MTSFFTHFFQNIPDSFRVLDLGSGTGAVVLGLLSLFSTSPLSRVAVNITALDCCAEALNRQKSLIEKAGFNSEQVHRYEEDLCDIDSCIKLAKKEGPYYLIFLANCLTELEEDVAINLVGRLPEILGNNGAIIIAESQRNYIKKLIKTLAETVEEYGLHVYYPCPATGCLCTSPSWCWVWRDHEYKSPSIKVSGQPLIVKPKEKFPISWLILTRQKVSIYDISTEKRPDLLWGPLSFFGSDSKNYDSQVCASSGIINRLRIGKSIKRGSLVGGTGEPFHIDQHCEL